MTDSKQLEMFSKKEMGRRPQPFNGNKLVQEQYVDESEKRQYELLLPANDNKKATPKIAQKAKRSFRK